MKFNFSSIFNKLNQKENCLDKTLIISLFIFMILPFLLMCFFNYPSGDDFITVNFYLKHGLINSVVFNYLNHTARYFAVLLDDSIINPLFFDNTFLWYKIYSFINICLLIFSIWFCIDALNKFYLKMPRFKNFIILFIILFMFLSNTKSIAELLYWFVGYSVYTVSLELFLIAIGLWMYFINTKNVILNTINYLFILLLIFCSLGGHEPFTAWIFCISSFYLYWAFKNNKVYKYQFLGVFVMVLFGFLLMYLAPGNKQRIADNRNIFVDSNLVKIGITSLISICRDFLGIIKWFFLLIF